MVGSGSGSSGAAGGGGGSFDPSVLSGLATEDWTDGNYLSKNFFNALFTVHTSIHIVVTDSGGETIDDYTEEGTLAPNQLPGQVVETDSSTGETTTTTTSITSIEAKFGLYTYQFLSALGLNDGGGGGGGGGVTSITAGTGLSGGTITSSGTIAINSTYQQYIQHGETAYNNLSNYLSKSGGSMLNTNLVTNMNADLLDGKHIVTPGSENVAGSYADRIPFIGSDYVMEVGRYIDFHSADGTGDFVTRVALDSTASGNTVTLPKSTGTLALTSDLNGYATQSWVTQNFVSELGTDGNYLRWKKNSSWNNITIPYASNAGQLSGHSLASGNTVYDRIPLVGSDGVMEIGLYIDFNYDDDDDDFLTRIVAQGWGSPARSANTVSLPTGSGTLALTSDTVARALRLDDDNTCSAWGQQFWANGVPNSISGNMTNVGDITAKSGVDSRINGFTGLELNSLGTLSGYGGFIDFHYNGLSGDYTSRIIEDASGRIKVDAQLYIPPANSIRIGDGLLTWDSTNHAIKLIDSNGNAANFYATGGVSALGLSTGGSITNLTVTNNLSIGVSITQPSGSNLFIGAPNGSVCFRDIQSQLNDSSQNEIYWYITQEGVARFNQVWLDGSSYLYVSGGVLYYYDGLYSRSRQIAFIN